MINLQPISYLGDYIDGRFVRSNRPDTEWETKSPGDHKDHIITLSAKFDHVDEACLSARKAYRSWSELSTEDRKVFLLRLKEVYGNHQEEIAQTIARETGKPLWESKTEAKVLVDKIDVTLNQSMKLVADVPLETSGPNVTGTTKFKSRGVMAVIGPFNFPAHLPNSHFIPALITGNTIVFKPSEFTPAMGQLFAQLFEKAEFPKGVFNLVQGKGETGRRLVANENIEGILFTGSYETGLKIKQEILNHFWKIPVLEMGGKNAAIVWDDADLEKALFENLVGCFISSGQRCTGTSRLILNSKIADQFISKFYQAAKKLSIGYWQDDPFMGPLISTTSLENYVRFQGIATREGAECVMRGKPWEGAREGSYVTPSIYRVLKRNSESIYQKTEIFGPNVAIYTADDFEEAIDINNSSSYGLTLSVFSKNRAHYNRAIQRARVGIVNWNRATIGANGGQPFGGMGKSGNDRPSSHFAVYYCTVPVATIEDHSPFDANQVFPGMNYRD